MEDIHPRSVNIGMYMCTDLSICPILREFRIWSRKEKGETKKEKISVGEKMKRSEKRERGRERLFFRADGMSRGSSSSTKRIRSASEGIGGELKFSGQIRCCSTASRLCT